MLVNNIGGQTNQNYGARQNMELGVNTFAGFVRHDLLRFDVTALAGEIGTINSITLRLTITSGAQLGGGQDVDGPGVVEVRQLLAANSAWVEGTGVSAGGADPPDNGESTWFARIHSTTPWAGTQGASAPGSDHAAAILASVAFADGMTGALDFVFADTSFFAVWVAGSNPGLFLRAQSEATINAISFATREATDAATRPMLIVDYEPPVPEPTGLALAAGGLMALASRYRRRR